MVALAIVVQSVSLLVGAVAGTATTWLARRSWVASFVGFLLGGLVGSVTGPFLARLLYRTADGMTTIVRVGTSSLPATVGAGLAGGLTTALAVAALAALLPSARKKATWVTSLGLGATLGALLACCSSLL